MFPLSCGRTVTASFAAQVTHCWQSVSYPADWTSDGTSICPLVPGNVREGCWPGQVLGCLLPSSDNVPTRLFIFTFSTALEAENLTQRSGGGVGDRIAGVSFSPLLSFHYCDSNAAWATEKKVGCQKIKCLIRRFGLYLQGSHLQVKCQGGGAHGGQRAMEVACSHGTERGDSPGPGWHCPRLPCGYRTRVSAIILVSVHDDRVPREQLETSSPFLPFSRSINIESIANPPPPSQTSSPLPNSSSSKDEIEPCHSGNPFPLALSCEPL